MFEYAFISGMFGNVIVDCSDFLKRTITVVFHHCTKGVAFNFTSNYVNHIDPGLAYHDPIEIYDYCLKSLTRKVTIHHHYERCDVAVYLYR